MWQLNIKDPSGETRIYSLSDHRFLEDGPIRIGRGSTSHIVLRDSRIAPEAAQIFRSPENTPQASPYWIKILGSHDSVMRLGDLAIHEAHFPLGVPLRLGETLMTLERESQSQSMPEQPQQLRPWLTCSESGRQLLWNAKKSAATPLSLYIAGETGTGKEVLAHLLHAWSPRAAGPFVPLHCAALPLSLAESELFGHVKGAFTGATHQRPGALMQAHGGTLFLDEIGDLPMDIQVKLLRFLENGEIRPVGADKVSRVDVRLVCATHHPLKKLVTEGKFRRDLYYRLASVTLEIPSLRSRPEDIELLARKLCIELGKFISPRAILRLQAHSWPGNVRELRHTIENACGMAGPFEKILGEDAFSFLLNAQTLSETPELELGSAMLSLEEMERHMVIKALRLAHGNRANAAKILGIARSTLFEMLKRHKIPGPRAKPQAIVGKLNANSIMPSAWAS